MDHPMHEQIALRAYQLWEQRDRAWGTPEIDWLMAEFELASRNPEGTLSKVAREVGSVVGKVIATLSDFELR